MNMKEHPIEQKITSIDISNGEEGIDNYVVGNSNVTSIVACQKSGMHSNIPYLRVMKGEKCIAEFCQHNIIGVYFKT